MNLSAKNKWFMLAMLALGGTVRKYRKGMGELVKIQTAIYQLRLMRGARSICLRGVQLAACVIFFFSGLIVLQAALYLMLSSGPSPAARVMLALGFAQALPSAGFVFWFLSSRRWLQETFGKDTVFEKGAKHAKNF